MSKLYKLAKEFESKLEPDNDPTVKTLKLINQYSKEIQDNLKKGELDPLWKAKLSIAYGLLGDIRNYLSED